MLIEAKRARPRIKLATLLADHVPQRLAAALAEMAGWMGLAGGVVVEPRGDLAPALGAAIGSVAAG